MCSSSKNYLSSENVYLQMWWGFQCVTYCSWLEMLGNRFAALCNVGAQQWEEGDPNVKGNNVNGFGGTYC